MLLLIAVVIKAGTLFDGMGGVPLHDRVIVIEDGRITGVEAAGKRKADIDLSGLTVMPGWVDTHTHPAWHFDDNDRLAQGASNDTTLHIAANAYRTLQAGFTTIQSLGDPLDAPVRRMIERGLLPGPRLLTSLGSLNERSGTPEQIRERVRKFKDDGADVIKLFATASIRDGGRQTMTDEQVAAACGEARAQGLRAVVHAHAPGGAMAAVKAGCTSIEHGVLLDDATFAAIAKAGLYFDPNLLVLHNYLDNKPKFFGIGNYNEAGFASMEAAITKQRPVMQMALRNRVRIVFGTDAVAGAHGRNAVEFIYRVEEAGMTPMQALVSAQSTAADSLGLKTGRLAPGFDADIIALDGDPLKDITAVRRVVFVMRAGKVYKGR